MNRRMYCPIWRWARSDLGCSIWPPPSISVHCPTDNSLYLHTFYANPNSHPASLTTRLDRAHSVSREEVAAQYSLIDSAISVNSAARHVHHWPHQLTLKSGELCPWKDASCGRAFSSDRLPSPSVQQRTVSFSMPASMVSKHPLSMPDDLPARTTSKRRRTDGLQPSAAPDATALDSPPAFTVPAAQNPRVSQPF
ncbi:hypothetical protein F4604DRAFT_1928234 [Suillus subluteus]|nr:hypothetical protein F4604DRAFT_1928234 [Suillus subluteus]